MSPGCALAFLGGELHRIVVADAHCEQLHICPLMLTVADGFELAKFRPVTVTEANPEVTRLTGSE